jgi:hypothetical protein
LHGIDGTDAETAWKLLTRARTELQDRDFTDGPRTSIYRIPFRMYTMALLLLKLILLDDIDTADEDASCCCYCCCY